LAFLDATKVFEAFALGKCSILEHAIFRKPGVK